MPPEAASPAIRAGELWVAVESEEVPPIVQFSAQAGNGTVGGTSELVRVGRLELPASCSQSKRATNCATPGYQILQLWSNMWSTPDFDQLPARGKTAWGHVSQGPPASPGTAPRTLGLLLPNVARYQLRYTRKSRGCRQPSGSSCSPLYIIFPRMSNVLVSAVCAEAQRHMKGRLTVSAGPPRSSRYPDWGKTGSPRGRADIQWEEPPAEFPRPDFLPLAAISPL